MRNTFDTSEEYDEYFASDEANRLFKELIVDKLETSKIMLLLKENPLSTEEIAETLDMTPAEVSRHLAGSMKQGLVRFDESQKSFAAV